MTLLRTLQWNLKGLAGPTKGYHIVESDGRIGGKGREGVGVINEVIEAGNRSLSHPSLMTRPELHCLRRGHFVMGVVSNVRQKRRHPFSPPIYVTFLNILIQDDAEESLNEAKDVYIYIYF